MIELLLANVELIIFIILVIFGVGYNIYKFFTSPSEKRQELIKIWLLEAVVQAELTWTDKGLGYIKFSEVYQKLISEYGLLAKFISKDTIEKLIDEALIVMKETLSNKENSK